MFPPIPSPIVRHIIYPVYRGLRGDRVLDLLDRLEHDQFLPAGDIEDMKWRRMRDLLERAREHVPYYRDLFERHGIDPVRASDPEGFAKVPELSRETVRKEGKRMVTRDPMRRGLRSGTGGSAGEPPYLWCDEAAGPLRRANTLRGCRWTGFDIGDRQAVLRGADPVRPVKARLAGGLKNYLGNVLCLSSFGMTPGVLRGYASKLSGWRPHLVIGCPSVLALFSEFCEREGIEIHRPLAVVTGGESLFPRQREIIESAFGAPAFNRYGTREFAYVAQECERHEGLHVFEDLYHVEVMHGSGRPARSGEVGELVITDLSNMYMPFIRYRTGDLAVPTGRACSCGRGLRVLEKIEGRKDLEEGNARSPKSGIRENCGEDLRADARKVEEVPPGRSGKSRYIVSNIEERLVVKSKIHKAHISEEDPEGTDCLRIDARLMELGDIAEWEKILIVNATNGARLETFAVGTDASGAIEACGSVSRHCRGGDEISIMAFTWTSGPEGRFSNILVDEDNRFVRRLTEIAGERI